MALSLGTREGLRGAPFRIAGFVVPVALGTARDADVSPVAVLAVDLCGRMVDAFWAMFVDAGLIGACLHAIGA